MILINSLNKHGKSMTERQLRLKNFQKKTSNILKIVYVQGDYFLFSTDIWGDTSGEAKSHSLFFPLNA